MVAHLTPEISPKLSGFIKEKLNLNSYSCIPLAGDASTRRYYRVVSGSQSWVVMEWDPFESPDKFPFLSIQAHLKKNKVPVPEVLCFDQTTGLFLIEDLGDLTLERKFWEFSKQESALPFYQVSLDHLIRLHRLYSKKENIAQCTAYGIAFDVEKLTWELNYTFKNLFTILCPHSLTPEKQESLQNEFHQLAKTLAEAPQVLCHRDFHSRNIMIKGDQIYFIDFQDARLGPPQYDLVSLVHDSYVNLSEESLQSLLEYYLEHFPEALKMFASKKEFFHYFDLQTLQRCFKACGTFAAIFNQRSDSRYLKYLPNTLLKVQAALKSTRQFPMMSQLVEQLRLPQIEKWP